MNETTVIVLAAERPIMRISARNNLRGRIARIVHGPTGADVTIHVAPGVQSVSTVADTCVRELGLREGIDVHAIVTASSVMVAAD